jgi:hypothetical protein
MESCGPGTEILCQCWPLSMTEERLPSTFFSILIFATHAHLASLLLNTICFTSLATWRVSGPLQWSFPSALTHLQSLTTGLCPGTQQLTYFRRLSTNSLVALDSVFVIVSKISPFLRANEVLLGRFFFLALDGFLIICSCQNSQFQLLCTSI